MFDFLFCWMCYKIDFLVLFELVSVINKIVNSEMESINKFFNFIFKDFVLINKLLCLVNFVYFCFVGGGSISIVLWVVVVFGFEVVCNIVIMVLLFEYLQNKINVNQFKEDFLCVNLVGIFVKDFSVMIQMCDLE